MTSRMQYQGREGINEDLRRYTVHSDLPLLPPVHSIVSKNRKIARKIC